MRPSQASHILVNDGGTSVAPVARAWNRVFAVELIDLDRRMGPAVARNVGIERAAGKYIAFLDDDDLFLPGHLAGGRALLESGDVDLVYQGAIVADRRVRRIPTRLDQFPHKAYAYDRRFLLVANYIHTGSVIVRNFKHTPVRFDESLTVCEDWDLWLALTNVLGYRAAFSSKITTLYHQVPDTLGLVAAGQQRSPSAFEPARSRIYAKWPCDEPLVREYRAWLGEFERCRSHLIAEGRRMPNLLFDKVLRYVDARMSCERPPQYDDIDRLFFQAEPELS
jgi:glycosyltransferase involved in cell wall biosynthesis